MSAKINQHKYHLDNAYFESPLIFGKTKLLQAGRLYCNSGDVIPEHTHEMLFEITIATSGKGTVYTNGIPSDISIGDIYLSFPHDAHKIVADTDAPLQYDFFAFDTSDHTLKSALLSLSETNSDPKKRVFHDDRISELVAELIGEIKFGDTHSKRMIENICEQIEVHIIRAFLSSENNNRRDSVTDAEALCYRAMNYINSHIFSMKNLTEVSEAISYNYSYMSNLFKRTTGQTMMDYYRVKRLETAKQLLDEQGRSITKIAEALNYSSVYAFSRAFKSHFGISPHQYKTKQ